MLPSFIIIILIASFLYKYITNEWVSYAFEGIRVCIVLLMVLSVFKLAKTDKKSLFYFIVLAISFAVATFTDMNVIILLIIMMFAGILYGILKRRRNID